MPQTLFGRVKSVAGAALVGLGIFILHQNLAHAATQFNHLLGTVSVEGPAALPAFIVTARRVLHASAPDHQSFLQGFLRHVLVSCWPLLLVTIGLAWSRNVMTDTVTRSKKECERVDPAGVHSTSK